MITLRYRVTLREPVLVTALEGDPNNSVSYKYLPGSVMRGAFIGRWLRDNGNPDEFDNKGTVGRQLFFSGDTRFLNAYLVAENIRAFPTPQSWRLKRDAADRKLYDALDKTNADAQRGAKGVKKPFFVPTQTGIHLLEPSQQVSVHTFRQNRSLGRPRREAGAVYQYVALAANQTFEGLIVCDIDEHANVLRNLLTGEYFVGGARSAGYGRVEVHLVDNEATEYAHQSDVYDQVNMILLSDLILRDRYGQYSTDPEVLQNGFAALFGHAENTWSLAESILKMGMVGGFNQKWGLPLPQAQVIQAGSVFRFNIPGSLTAAQLDAIAYRGIGERRIDGFGRIVFEHFSGEVVSEEEEKPQTEPQRASLDGQAQPVAELMVKRMREQRLQTRIVATAQKKELDNKFNKLKKAQIGRLRNAIRDALNDQSKNPRETISNYMQSVDKRQKARKQFESARIGEQRLLNWINEMLAIASVKEWKEKFPPDKAETEPYFGVKVEDDQIKWEQDILRLIDAVLARFAKLPETEE